MHEARSRRCTGNGAAQMIFEIGNARRQSGARHFDDEHLVAVGQFGEIRVGAVAEREIACAQIGFAMPLPVERMSPVLEVKDYPVRPVTRAVFPALDQSALRRRADHRQVAQMPTRHMCVEIVGG